MSKILPPPDGTVDPVPEPVESRFRLLNELTAENPAHRTFDRYVDEGLQRARRLDDQIVRTIATSTTGLLAQLRLLSAFYEQSTNGMGRRGAVLIQTITVGIERLDRGDLLNRCDEQFPASDLLYSSRTDGKTAWEPRNSSPSGAIDLDWSMAEESAEP